MRHHRWDSAGQFRFVHQRRPEGGRRSPDTACLCAAGRVQAHPHGLASDRGTRGDGAGRRGRTRARAGPDRASLLVATVNFPFVATETAHFSGWRALPCVPRCWRIQQRGSGGQMHGWETRMLLRHSLQRGVSKAALARRFGVSRRTIHEWVETGQLDRDLVVRGCALLATSSRAPQAGSLHQDHRGTCRGVPRSVGEASVRRGPRGGLPRGLQPCAGLRPRGTPARAGRGGGAVRDAGGARARWTSRRSRCPGAAGTPWWWC